MHLRPLLGARDRLLSLGLAALATSGRSVSKKSASENESFQTTRRLSPKCFTALHGYVPGNVTLFNVSVNGQIPINNYNLSYRYSVAVFSPPPHYCCNAKMRTLDGAVRPLVQDGYYFVFFFFFFYSVSVFIEVVHI